MSKSQNRTSHINSKYEQNSWINGSFSSYFAVFFVRKPNRDPPTRYRFIINNNKSSSPPSSLTKVHRCIGYHNPNWHILFQSVRLTYLSVYYNRDNASETGLSPCLSKSSSLTYLSVYDSRDSVSEDTLSPPPLSSFTYVHRCIGYCNPNWYSLPKSVRLTNLSVYDSRDDALETALSPSRPSSIMLVHRRCIGYHNPNWHSLPKSARLTNLNVYDNST